ncbi:hypothetical protein IWQ60_009918 [Tieghemiomyces parasiticus]|uniref:Bromo domain-containing protein n=1 Tax=Tieghemiomyces parasiticus TaxID=78921 RepID=A0A9W7ZW17_9FUNG|nr:hypothetical protein IWQ60_009918 [Tieghemiomyces parasiticus]
MTTQPATAPVATTRNTLLLLYAILRHGHGDWSHIARTTAESLVNITHHVRHPESEAKQLLDTLLTSSLSPDACRQQYETLVREYATEGDTPADDKAVTERIAARVRKQYIEELEIKAQENREEFKRLVSDLKSINQHPSETTVMKRKIDEIIARRKRRRLNRDAALGSAAWSAGETTESSASPEPAPALPAMEGVEAVANVHPVEHPETKGVKGEISEANESKLPPSSPEPTATGATEPTRSPSPATEVSVAGSKDVEMLSAPSSPAPAPLVLAKPDPGTPQPTSTPSSPTSSIAQATSPVNAEQAEPTPLSHHKDLPASSPKSPIMPVAVSSGAAKVESEITEITTDAPIVKTEPASPPATTKPIGVPTITETKPARPSSPPPTESNQPTDGTKSEDEKEAVAVASSNAKTSAMLTETGPCEVTGTKGKDDGEAKDENMEVVENEDDDEGEEEEDDTESQTSHRPRHPETAEEETAEQRDRDKKLKNWKKLIGMIWRNIANHRAASLFEGPIKAQDAPGYHDLIKRPIDLKAIRLRIRDDKITTTDEFHRDILLMLMNALMYNSEDSEVYQMTLEMYEAAEDIIATFKNSEAFSSRPSGSAGSHY